MDQTIPTTDEVIDSLGGTAEVSRHCGVTMQAVSNWRADGAIPERHHYRLFRLAEERGISIPEAYFSAGGAAA